MIGKQVFLVGFLGLAAAFTSCSKDPLSGLTQEESRIYITDHDSSKNFASYSTFRVSDSVTVVENGRKTSVQLNEADRSFVDAVKSELTARGYQQISKDSTPDLGVNVTRVYNTSTGIVSYDDYYGAYGNYYDPFYWGYGGYSYYSPYSYATYRVTEGALAVDILDLKNAPAANKIEVVWTGLIRGSGIFNGSAAASQVKALFDQSGYLKAR